MQLRLIHQAKVKDDYKPKKHSQVYVQVKDQKDEDGDPIPDDICTGWYIGNALFDDPENPPDELVVTIEEVDD